MHGLNTIIKQNRDAVIETMLAKVVADHPDMSYDRAGLAVDRYAEASARDLYPTLQAIETLFPELKEIFIHIRTEDVA